jgi:hypothetical protein
MKTARTVINLQKYRADSATSYTGRPEGGEARKDAKLDFKDKDDNFYDVLIPLGTTALNPSFFLGFFYSSISKLGLDVFNEKYNIIFEDKDTLKQSIILNDIEEGKRHASNQINSKRGLLKFLKRD